MWKKLRNVCIALLTFVLVALILMIVFSPFGKKQGFDYKLAIHSVEIEAPVDSVYQFLGNSDNAKKWSVFVDHIVPLNGDKVKDGKAGSIRRCYKNADEQGLQWDELTTVVEKNKRRQLTIFNMKGFDMKAEGLATEQLYETVSPTKTKLSFTLFYKDHDPSLIDLLKTYFAAFEVVDIYERNMNNVKMLVEKRIAVQ